MLLTSIADNFCVCIHYAVLGRLFGPDSYKGLPKARFTKINDTNEQWRSYKIKICSVPQGEYIHMIISYMV